MVNHQITLTEANANLNELCEQVVADRDFVIITRPDGENVALIAADELNSLLETVHLLRSPKNAERLLSAIKEAKAISLKPQTLKEVRQELGIGEEG
ncbi:type II toxin-antitoxin system Phd/YefM family antitoxin [Ancylothrix sp. C2]|uniref:type II toxin-antitoxin system Phd/YefM family antitoxin n=1 Tax=Ancylothrix sp. D3o TaxID=2953691 RepID=UPI0021BA9917|nr:type II toxin-antitoxin system Phd/YefM family antitoxin [Ancylothrix sp. D3o]MCT7952042.1 type II toxin-antitoxin system Phd/YefM family antitoxin [Ancylothrix sp. D3o]